MRTWCGGCWVIHECVQHARAHTHTHTHTHMRCVMAMNARTTYTPKMCAKYSKYCERECVDVCISFTLYANFTVRARARFMRTHHTRGCLRRWWWLWWWKQSGGWVWGCGVAVFNCAYCINMGTVKDYKFAAPELCAKVHDCAHCRAFNKAPR